jgi:ankyrin repeat protein
MARKQLFLGMIALGLAATPAAGQVMYGSDGERFVSAVRDRDGGEAMELLNSRGPTVLNARDAKGDTGLIIAISERDDLWTSFLLQQGADPNLRGRNGDTPLIAAARIGYTEAAAQLIRRKAKVDGDNRMGETPLIIAVQLRNVPMVKLLLEAGANPDKPDSAAGYSARDYARRDTRSREILKLIEAKKPPPKA